MISLLYLFWLVHIVCGALIDARMWGVKENDNLFIQKYTDVYWLGYFALVAFLPAYLYSIGVVILSWKSLLIGCGMSVVWDLIFVKNESGVWIKPIPIWLTIPIPFYSAGSWYKERIVIGFKTLPGMIAFHSIRVIVLIGTFFL